jgi:hypothetical protein
LQSLNIKHGHDDKDVLDAWNLEKEKSGPNLLEVASPCDLSEDEVQFAIGMTNAFIGRHRGQQFSSSQGHVEGRCLLTDDRLTGLLLLWENYHKALHNFIQARVRSSEFAGSIQERNPMLLAALQARWNSRAVKEEPLEDVFHRHASSIVGLESDRDGYRNFAINVCHLLHIDCCRNCTKNLTPKFGSVEFRLFNTEFGAPLQRALQLMQRTIQKTCEMPVSELHKWTLNEGAQPSTSVYPLFDLLELPREDMDAAFLEGGAEKWQMQCSHTVDSEY